jgi:hypothetical protein
LEHFIFWGSGSKSNGALRFREKGNAKIFAMMVACHQLLSLAGAMATLRVAISKRTRVSSVTERQPSKQSCRSPRPATWTPIDFDQKHGRPLLMRPDLYWAMIEAYAVFFRGSEPARAMFCFGTDIRGALVATEAIALA